jgi:hypothetical protein
VEPVDPGVAARSARLCDENVYETEAATNDYLACIRTPGETLSDILVSRRSPRHGRAC